MRIKKRSYFEILLLLLIVAFVGQGTNLVDAVISLNFRWILLLLMLLYLIATKKFLNNAASHIMMILISYQVWCITTTVWSGVPLLSFMKSAMFVLVSITLVSAGKEWVRRNGACRALDVFLLIVVVTLVSGVLGDYAHVNDSLNVYNNLGRDANEFGFLAALSAPLLLWRMYHSWNKLNMRLVYGLLLFICVYFLARSFSRSAALMASSIALFFVFSLSLQKKLVLLFAGTLILLMSMLFMAPLIIGFAQLHFYKSYTDVDALKSRQQAWHKSYIQAVKGGWLGGGYGATIGDNSFVMKGLNARGYGREKANSQLAIIEETGIVGFVFYCALLIIFFTKGIRCFLRMSGEEKVAMGLILGTLVGLLLESVAEGWWDAPGGQEFTSFWVLFGLAMGVMSLEKRKMRYGYSSMEAPPREVLSESPATS